MTTTEHAAFVDGLRQLADFLAERPQLVNEHSPFHLDIFADDIDSARSLARQLGGRREKELAGSYYTVKRSFGPHSIEINIRREQVCERVVTGIRLVEAEEEYYEDIYEWRCDEAKTAVL